MPNYIWLTPENFVVVQNATGPSAVGDAAQGIDKASALAFPNGALGIVTSSIMMPSDWNGGLVTVFLHWSRTGGAAATAVAWEVATATINPGEQVDKAGSVIAQTPTVPNAEALARTQIGTFQPSANRAVRVAVQRLASDTFGGTAWLIGVELSYILA